MEDRHKPTLQNVSQRRRDVKAEDRHKGTHMQYGDDMSGKLPYTHQTTCSILLVV